MHRAGWRVAGVDLSAVAVAAAAQCNPGRCYQQADLLCLPLRSSSFDAGLDRSWRSLDVRCSVTAEPDPSWLRSTFNRAVTA